MTQRPPLSYTTTKLTLGTFLRIMFRPRYLDRDKIPVDGPLIIAANHLSHHPNALQGHSPQPA